MKTIVVTGTHSVGKTVLCNSLREALAGRLDVKIIPEMARLLIARGMSMNDKVSEVGIVSYIRTYLKYTRECKASLVISDRSVFDLFVYISVSRPDEVREEFFRLAEEVVHQEVERVHSYIYVPIEFALQADEVRPKDVIYQRTVDKKVRDLLSVFDAKVLTVSGAVEERVAAVRRWLDV